MTSVSNPQPEQDGPYAAAAMRYQAAGWAPLPLPPRAKKHPPAGWTGARGAWPSGADVYAWTEDHPDGNLALRLAPDVVGFDVDHYDGKPGGLLLAQLEQQLGDLPATWRSTSRDDGTSGIRLYRAPAGLRWPSVLGPGIEVIRHEHRYTVAWPSIHPDTGSTYRWITPDGATALDAIPTPTDLPTLPEPWVTHFTRGELATDQPHAGLDSATSSAWMTERGTGTPCNRIQHALQQAASDLTTATSRHDAALAGTNRLVWLAGEGHPGATTALQQLGAAFLAATGTDRADGEAEQEWDRMVLGAINLAAPAHPTPSADPCTDPFAGLIPKETTWTTAPPTSTTSTPSPTAPPATGPAAATPDSPAPSATAGDTSTPASSPRPSSPASTSTPARASATTAAPPQTPSTTTPAPPAGTAENPAGTAPAPAADPDALDPDKLHLYYLEELARITGRQAAQKHYEDTNRDQVIADRVRRKMLDDEAKLEHRRLTEPPAPPFDAGTLADILARPDDPPMRVQGLIPWEASTLIVAARKTGKTTTMLNYARCLLTGEDFLDEFPTIPLEEDQRVGFLNYEVSPKQVARWAAELGIDPDRLYLVNLRGRRNPLSRDDDRAELAEHLRDMHVRALMVDPFGRAFTGESQNDNAEVQRFLVDLDTFARNDVGANDLILAAHAGWDGERSRGASALEDWPDTIINLSGDGEGEDRRRFMRAIGRDVEVDEDELIMDPLTRILSRAGNGGRKSKGPSLAKVAALAAGAARAVTANPGCSRADVGRALADMPELPPIPKGGRGKDLLTTVLKQAERDGSIVCQKGANGYPNTYFATELSTTGPTSPGPVPGLGGPRSPTYREGTGYGVGSAKNDGTGSDPDRWVPIAGGKSEVNTRTKEVRDK